MTNRIYQGNGFSVEPHGFHSVKYSEGEYAAIVSGERCIPVHGGPQYVLWGDTLTSWLAPHQSESLTDQQKATILDRIEEAFEHWKFPYLIER